MCERASLSAGEMCLLSWSSPGALPPRMHLLRKYTQAGAQAGLLTVSRDRAPSHGPEMGRRCTGEWPVLASCGQLGSPIHELAGLRKWGPWRWKVTRPAVSSTSLGPWALWSPQLDSGAVSSEAGVAGLCCAHKTTALQAFPTPLKAENAEAQALSRGKMGENPLAGEPDTNQQEARGIGMGRPRSWAA